MSDKIKRRVWKILGWIVGGALMVAAVWVAVGEVSIEFFLQKVSLGEAGLLGGLVLGNLLLTGLMFWVVTLSFETRRPVGLGKMMALIGVSALLNYLPMRAGLVGRAVYLKAAHGLSLKDSGVIVLAVTGVGAVVLLAVCLVALNLYAMLGLVVAIQIFWSAAIWEQKRASWKLIYGWSWIPIKFVDALVGGFRLWVALHMVGYEIAFEQALLLSAAGMLMMLVSVTPNGLGLREWAIAGVAAVGGVIEPEAALAAAVIDRAVEVVVIVVAGGASIFFLRGGGEKATIERKDAEG